METGRFYYCVNGTDVQGPVAWGVLHQLYQDGLLGEGAQLCREGEAEWEPLDPAVFTLQSPQPVVVKPSRRRPEYVVQRGAIWGDEDYKGPVAISLEVIGWFAAAGAALVTTALMHFDAQSGGTALARAGGFAGGLLFYGLLPFLVSLFFGGWTQSCIRAGGMILLAVLGIVGQVNSPGASALSTADALQDKTRDEAKKEIAVKGFYSGDPQKAQQDVQQLRNQLTDNSEISRLSRDLLDVTQELVGKVKVSDDAEKACDFDVNSIATQDDITSRRQRLGKLRAAEDDVRNYLENYDAHCRDAMARENSPEATIASMVAGARKGSHVDLLVTLWQQKVKLTDDYVARLDFLSQKFGAWSAKDDKIVFRDDAAVADYNKLIGTLHDDVVQLEATQKQFFQ